eukprot:scaffold64232_cov68-Phaeocystis_antarctica.AAC.6
MAFSCAHVGAVRCGGGGVKLEGTRTPERQRLRLPPRGPTTMRACTVGGRSCGSSSPSHSSTAVASRVTT